MFRPMIRWILFPSLAALAGAAAGAGVAFLINPIEALEFAAIAAPMALAGALGFALPGPAWLAASAAPILGGAFFCGAYSAYVRVTGKGTDGTPLAVLRKLLTSESEWMITIAVFSLALAAAHRLRLRGLRSGVLSYLGAAVVMCVGGWLAIDGHEDYMVGLGSAMALANALAMEVAFRVNAAMPGTRSDPAAPRD